MNVNDANDICAASLSALFYKVPHVSYMCISQDCGQLNRTLRSRLESAQPNLKKWNSTPLICIVHIVHTSFTACSACWGNGTADERRSLSFCLILYGKSVQTMARDVIDRANARHYGNADEAGQWAQKTIIMTSHRNKHGFVADWSKC